MALLFHPQIVDLINAADEVLEGRTEGRSELLEAVTQAEETHQWQSERFLYFRQGQECSAESQSLATALQGHLDQRAEALGRVRQGCEDESLEPLRDAILVVQKASQNITKASEDLERLDSATPLSPFPLLHDFLRAGANVQEGTVESESLTSRLPALIAWVDDVVEDWNTERELFTELLPMDDEFNGIVEELQNGVGGVFVFLDEGDKRDLEAGLAAIARASQKLGQFIGRAQLEASDKAMHSPYREIERWTVRSSREPRDEQAVAEARQSVAELLETQQQQLSGLGEIPFDSEEYLAAFEAVESAMAEEFAALEADDVERLCQASQNHEVALEGLATTLAAASVDLEEAPALQELRKVVLGVYYRQTPRRFLRSLLDTLVPGFQRALAAEADEAARLALADCLTAFEHAINGLDDESITDLVDAWRLINSGGAALIAVQRHRIAEEEAEKERRQLACPACGRRNDPEIAKCACGARLLVATIGQLEAASRVGISVKEGPPSLTNPSAPKPKSQHLLQLLTLATRIHTGTAGPQEIQKTLEPHLQRVNSLLQQTPGEGKGRFFRQSVRKFQRGLESLADQAQRPSAAGLVSGIELILEAGQELGTFQQ